MLLPPLLLLLSLLLSSPTHHTTSWPFPIPRVWVIIHIYRIYIRTVKCLVYYHIIKSTGIGQSSLQSWTRSQPILSLSPLSFAHRHPRRLSQRRQPSRPVLLQIVPFPPSRRTPPTLPRPLPPPMPNHQFPCRPGDAVIFVHRAPNSPTRPGTVRA